jgi:protein-S-isoprenylcysteine O-methyltransferase Ste14
VPSTSSVNTLLFVLASAWTGYFIIHSLLASLTVKQAVERSHPNWMPAYRLLFNAVAILLIIPPLLLTYAIDAPWLWQWRGGWLWLANALALLAIAGFIWSTRYYESGEFIGTRQWRERETRVDDQEHLHISPLHRYVRHPWYFFGLVLMWTRDMNAPLLLTIGFATLYFIFGSRLEERKLLRYYGDAYADYRRRVAGLIPLPWRYLSATEAQQLEQQAAGHQPTRSAGNPP